MHSVCSARRVLHPFILLAAAFLPLAAVAQTAANAIIEGRVLNDSNGNYLNNARVTIDGSTAEAFTNSFGEYRLTNVPPGAVTVRASYTGLTPESRRSASPPAHASPVISS